MSCSLRLGIHNTASLVELFNQFSRLLSYVPLLQPLSGDIVKVYGTQVYMNNSITHVSPDAR